MFTQVLNQKRQGITSSQPASSHLESKYSQRGGGAHDPHACDGRIGPGGSVAARAGGRAASRGAAGGRGDPGGQGRVDVVGRRGELARVGGADVGAEVACDGADFCGRRKSQG